MRSYNKTLWLTKHILPELLLKVVPANVSYRVSTPKIWLPLKYMEFLEGKGQYCNGFFLNSSIFPIARKTRVWLQCPPFCYNLTLNRHIYYCRIIHLFFCAYCYIIFTTEGNPAKISFRKGELGRVLDN